MENRKKKMENGFKNGYSQICSINKVLVIYLLNNFVAWL